MPQPPRQTPGGRFWTLVDRRGPRECWPWVGTTDRDGYGLFKVRGGETVGAHRYAALLDGLPVTPGAKVLHSCDTPPCCNPAHLRIGSHQDNMDDMVARGRQASTAGERNPGAKVTVETVRAIRGAVGTNAALARRYGLSPSQVSRIRSGARWPA